MLGIFTPFSWKLFMPLVLLVAHWFQICWRECLVSHVLEELLWKRWLPDIPLEELLRKLLLPVFFYIYFVSPRRARRPVLLKHNFNSFRVIGFAALASFEERHRTRIAILSRASATGSQVGSRDCKAICSNVTRMVWIACDGSARRMWPHEKMKVIGCDVEMLAQHIARREIWIVQSNWTKF